VRQLLARVVLILVVLCALSGCALFRSPDAAFVAGMDAGLSAGQNNADLLGKYDAYVDADPKLTAETKKIEHRTAAELRALLEAAKKK
jgi:hypothetical protein